MAAARDIDPSFISLIVADWEKQPHGQKGIVVQKWATILGVCKQTVQKVLPKNPKRKKREGERKIAGLEDATRIVAMLKYRAPEHRGTIPTRDALENAILNGKIGPEFADVHPSTFDRVMRDLGINPKRRRVERFQSDRPNEMHHMDASTSDCFYVYKRLPDGDFLLRLHKGHRDYKNKPIPVDALRPWYYGVVDDHSGIMRARMIAATGECAADNIDFLCSAWEEIGLPEKLKGDEGPMKKNPAVNELIDRLGIEIDPSIPGDKEAHGKIEVIWSKIWRSFEKAYFMNSDWKTFTITMSELMSRFNRWVERYNSNRHRYERKLTKQQAWDRISLNGGVVKIPEGALKTVARRWSRTVDQAGCFSIDTVIYEVKRLHDAKVWVLQGVFDDKMAVIDKADGKKYEVVDFRPNRIGEFHSNRETGYEQTRKAAAEMQGVENLLYTEQHAAFLAGSRPKKVTKMPTRVKEVRQIENPLDLDTYPSIAAAMKDFHALVGFFPEGDDYEVVTALIVESGLSRRFVVGLAAEVGVTQAAAM